MGTLDHAPGSEQAAEGQGADQQASGEPRPAVAQGEEEGNQRETGRSVTARPAASGMIGRWPRGEQG